MAVYLISGDDESIVRSHAIDLVKQLVGGGDRGLMVDEFDGEEYELRAVADAAQTMPFLTDRRVVVAREVGRFLADELAPLLAYLADPLESTELVLIAGGGRLAKKLVDAVTAASGHRLDTTPPRKDRGMWVRARATERGVDLDNGAAQRIAEQLGDDAGRLDGVVDVLRSTYGEGVRLSSADVEPFLGEAGGVPPWDLTDAIDKGRTDVALTLLQRMTRGGDRHPLQVLAILRTHYEKLARLDSADVRSEADAAAAAGVKPGFAARKLLDTYRRLGSSAIERAVQLLARADRDVHGESGLEPDLVMEILVARLTRIAR